MPYSNNVELLAYHDLDGRSGFKLAVQESEGRFFLYVAALWQPGFSILDVTDPERPELVRRVDRRQPGRHAGRVPDLGRLQAR